MSITNKIKAVLAFYGIKHKDLADHFGMIPQTLNSKFVRDSWSAKDLAKVAEFVGCKVGFIMPDGQYILLDADDDQQDNKKAPGE